MSIIIWEGKRKRNEFLDRYACVCVCICVCMLILVSSSSYYVRIVVITSRTSGDRMAVALAGSAGPGYYLSHYLPLVVRGVTDKDDGRRAENIEMKERGRAREKKKEKTKKSQVHQGREEIKKPGIWTWTRSLKSSPYRVHTTYIQCTSTLGRAFKLINHSFLPK